MGIGYDSSLWTLAQVPALSTRFRVVLVDNRDAGRSSKASHPYRIADMADDVAGLLDALGIAQSHLLGLSKGGMIALEFALRQADAYGQFDVLDRLGAITAPTLVVVGEQDLLTPPWIAREVAAAIPGARFEVIQGDGSSHVLPLERADDFNRLVSAFLTE